MTHREAACVFCCVFKSVPRLPLHRARAAHALYAPHAVCALYPPPFRARPAICFVEGYDAACTPKVRRFSEDGDAVDPCIAHSRATTRHNRERACGGWRRAGKAGLMLRRVSRNTSHAETLVRTMVNRTISFRKANALFISTLVMPLFTHEAEEVPGMPDPETPR